MNIKNKMEINENNVMKTIIDDKYTDILNCRKILWIMTFTGMAINVGVVHNFNIAIVDMVNQRPITSDFSTNSTPVPLNISMDETNATKKSYFSFEWILLDALQVNYTKNGFDWNEKQQNLVLGSFFWLHWLTQLLAGSITRKLGAKFVYGVGNLMGGILFALMPIAGYLNINSVMLLRFIQGIIMGPCWPAMHQIASSWIPPNERSKFMSSYLGATIGIIVLYPFFGYLMKNFCWELVFHITAFLAALWFICFQYLIYETPARHPRISASERCYIEESLADELSAQAQKLKIPWKSIISSKTVWATNLVFLGCMWAIFTMLAQGPTYFKIVHNYDLEAMGLLTGLPHTLRLLFGMGYSVFSDHLLSSGKLSKTNIRKCSVLITNSIAGCLLIGLGYFGNIPTLAPILFTFALMTNGAVPSGILTGVIDISPNFAAAILGLVGCVGILPGFISPYLVGLFTYNTNPIDGWCNVFVVAGTAIFASGIPYLLFADLRVKSWNGVQRKTTNNVDESISFNKVDTEEYLL